MGDTKTIRIYTPDWVRLSKWQAARAERALQTPAFADLIHEALDRMEAGGDM